MRNLYFNQVAAPCLFRGYISHFWRRKWKPTLAFLARIPWTEEPDRLQSMGLQTVRHDLVTKQQQLQTRTLGTS